MVNNMCVFVGRLTQDPEIKETSGGHKVCEFALAVNNGFGENRTTTFPTFEVWNATAENLVKYTRKGKMLAVQAHYTENHWEDTNGNKRKNVKFLVESVDFLERGGSSDNASDANSDANVVAADDDDSLPF